MRVLYITDSLMMGGVETQLVDLLRHLDRQQFQPSVLCLYGPRASSTHFVPQVQALGVPVLCLDRRYAAPDKVRMVGDIARAVRELRPDIVQAENYHANLLSRLARPLLGKTHLIGTQRTRYTTKQLRYEQLSQRMVDVMVASSPHLRTQLVEVAHLPPAKVEVIVNSIETSRFAQPHDPTLRQRLFPGMRRVLLSLGRISRQKRMHLLVEALGQLKTRGALPPDVCLAIVGPVQQPDMLDAITERVTRYGLEDVVRLFPGTDAPEDWYAAADMTMLFTTDEGLSCVMLESLAAGKPVLISEESNGAGIIAQGQHGWVVPTHDMSALADQLRTCLALSDADLAAMDDPCRSHAAHYDIHTLAHHYADLYTRLAA